MALSNDKSVLAVGRESGQIEIWKTDTFAQITMLPGHRNVQIRNIHWIEPSDKMDGKSTLCENPLYYNRMKGNKILEKKRRLVTTGLNGMICEWDLNTCSIKSKYNAHGPIWNS